MMIYDNISGLIEDFRCDSLRNLHFVAPSVMSWCLCRDTAGQERYQTITKQYYRRAQVSEPDGCHG